MSADKQVVMIDGTDALAWVVIYPNRDRDGNLLSAYAEAQSIGLSHAQAAKYLREIAAKWDPDGVS